MTDKTKLSLRAAVCGGLAGIVNGFFGGGGGSLLLPLFLRWLKLEERRAFATCVAVIVPLCAVSAALYLFRGALDIGAALPYLAGGALGGAAAGKFLPKTPVKLLRRAMAVLILLGGARALLWG